MKLLEYEGKALLAKHGIAIPNGALWPQLPPSEKGWVVKAQVLAGGRGKQGGIQMAAQRGDVERVAQGWTGKAIGAEPIHSAYVEERLDIAKEIYLAALVNRDQGRVNLIASAQGGVDIEQVPKSEIASVVVDPLIGLADFQVQALKRAVGVSGEAATDFARACKSIYSTLVEEDAELVEINPLVQLANGRLVAADAKVVLDDDAMSRHASRSQPIAWTTDSAFMQRCRELDVIGVDNRRLLAAGTPYVAVLGNGAGLTMASYDQVHLSGIAVGGAIELHGALARGVAHTANVISALFMLEADVYFSNAFYQLRAADALAEALVEALKRPGAPSRDQVVTRLRGVKQSGSQKIVEDAGCYYSASLAEATQRVISLARAAARKGAPAP